PATLVGGVIDVDIASLRPETPLAEVTRHLASYNLVAAPVLDRAGRLVGVVTVDDVLDHLLPANWRERQLDADVDARATPGALTPPAAGDVEPGSRGEAGSSPAAS
ncbi:magnesium transporter, partial [Frankia casuarinae]